MPFLPTEALEYHITRAPDINGSLNRSLGNVEDFLLDSLDQGDGTLRGYWEFGYSDGSVRQGGDV